MPGAPTSIQTRLETLIENIDRAEAAVRDGYRINIRLLDAESLAITKALKARPEAALQPLLRKTVLSIERLTHALEDRAAELKARKT